MFDLSLIHISCGNIKEGGNDTQSGQKFTDSRPLFTLIITTCCGANDDNLESYGLEHSVSPSL